MVAKAKKAKSPKPKSKANKPRITAPEPSFNGTPAKGATTPADDLDDSLRAIAEAERALEVAEGEYEDARVDAREAKARKEKLRKRLHEIIREETGLEPTLFNQQRKTKSEKATSAAIESAVEGNPTATDDEVRKVRWASLGLKPGLVEKLEKAGIETLGDYYDYVKPSSTGFQKRLTEIKGIGKAAVTEIENCEMEYVAELSRQRAAKAQETVEEVAAATIPFVDSKQRERAERVEDGPTV